MMLTTLNEINRNLKNNLKVCAHKIINKKRKSQKNINLQSQQLNPLTNTVDKQSGVLIKFKEGNGALTENNERRIILSTL